MKKQLIKITITTLSSLLLFLCLSTLLNVKAMSYNYDFFKNVVPSAEGLSFDSTQYSNSITPADPDEVSSYKLYVENNGIKHYVQMSDLDKGASLTTNASSGTLFEWNVEKNTLVVAEDENNRTFGAIGNAVYEYFMCSELTGKNNLCQFYHVDGTLATEVEPGQSYIIKAQNRNGDIYFDGTASKGTFNGTYQITSAVEVYVEGVATKIPMDDLRDMEVYEEKIYVLNTASSTNVKWHADVLDEKTGITEYKEVQSSIKNVGQIIVLNQQFQWEIIQDEFPFSQDFAYVDEDGKNVTIEEALLTMLNNYYNFKTPLRGIQTYQYANDTDLLTRAPYIPYSQDESRPAIRFRSPDGVTVTKDGIYVADTEGNQIVHLIFNEAAGIYEVSDIYVTPSDKSFYQVSSGVKSSEMSDQEKLFRPTKVAVDRSGRVYCIARDIYEGIIEYGKPNVKTRTGVFNRFLGKNEVVANPLKAFWGKIFSEAQLSSLTLDLPPMFTNITMDNNGEFLYATSIPDASAETGTTQANMVKAINTAGKDVMKRNGYVAPNGDALYTISSNDTKVITGASELQAVAVNDYYGIFTILDSKRGRLFTYDMEGNLLYITGEQPGGKKTQSTEESMAFCLSNPIAVDYFTRTYYDENNNPIIENGKEKVENLVIVLDKKSCCIVIYRTTDFGECVNIATKQYIEGEVIAAEAQWREVIKINTNYELAYLGIGKSVLRSATTIEEYQEAMEYFESAHSSLYYSKAYGLYRDAILRKYFSGIMTVGAILVVAIVSRKVYKHIKRKKENPFMNQGGDE